MLFSTVDASIQLSRLAALVASDFNINTPSSGYYGGTVFLCIVSHGHIASVKKTTSGRKKSPRQNGGRGGKWVKARGAAACGCVFLSVKKKTALENGRARGQ